MQALPSLILSALIHIIFCVCSAIADYSAAVNNYSMDDGEDSLSTVSSNMGLDRDSIDEFGINLCDFGAFDTHEFDLGLKADPSGISIQEMQNKQDMVSRLKARKKVMAGALKKLPKIQSRVIRLYLSSNYNGMNWA